MKVLAIITARTDSSRLTRKVLIPILRELNSLDIIYQRLKLSNRLDNVIIATSDNRTDDEIEALAKKRNYNIFRGKKNDVLDRIFRTCKWQNADLILRIPGDSPLIDPKLIDWQIRNHIDLRVDYSSNCLRRTFPFGVDVDAVSIKALKYVNQNARGYFIINKRKESFREHGFTPYILFHPQRFKILSLEATGKYSVPNLRFVLDYKEDLKLIKYLADKFGNKLLNMDTINIVEYLINSPVRNTNTNCINKWPSYLENKDVPISLEHISSVLKWKT